MIKKVGAFSVISLEWIGTPSEPLPPPTTHSRSSSSSSSSSVAGDRAHAFTMGVQKKLKMLQVTEEGANDLIQEVLLQAWDGTVETDNEPAWAPTTDASVRGDDSDDEE